MKKTLGLIVPVVPAILLLCGCGSFALPSVYILGNPTPAAVSVTSEDGLPIVAIDTVTVPDYLDSTDIVRHAGSNEVRVSATGKWGERLSVGLTRALVSALSRRLPHMVIERRTDDEAPWRVLVDIQRFDIGADGQCILTARWHIITTDGKTFSVGEDGNFVEPAAINTDAAVVTAMNLATDQLAGRIATSLQRVIVGPTASKN